MSAKRAVIEQKFKKMEAEVKRLGVTLLTKPEAFIDDDHLDCTWYGGYIGGLRYKGYVVSVAAMGDVRVSGEYKGVEVDYVDKQPTTILWLRDMCLFGMVGAPNAPPSVSLTCSSMRLSLSPPARPWTQRKWKSSTLSASSFPMPMRTTGGGFTPSMCEAKSLPRRRQTETHTSFETNFSTQQEGRKLLLLFEK